MLPGWEKTGYFSKTDRAALRLTKAVTRVPDGHVSDENYNAAAAALTPEQISAVTWLATVMNAFNRAATTSQFRSVAPQALGGTARFSTARPGHSCRPARRVTT